MMVSLAEPVVIVAEAPTGQIEAVERVLREAQIDATVEETHKRLVLTASADISAELAPWVLRVSFGGGLAAFFAALGAQAGNDAYTALRQLCTNLRACDHHGGIEFTDEARNWVSIDAGLPDEALRALLDIDWAETRAGCLLWKDGEWYNATPTREDGE